MRQTRFDPNDFKLQMEAANTYCFKTPIGYYCDEFRSLNCHRKWWCWQYLFKPKSNYVALPLVFITKIPKMKTIYLYKRY